MKNFLIIAGLALSVLQTTAKADDCTYLCDKIQSDSGLRLACMQTVKAGYTQLGACRVCDVISTASGTVSCLQQIVDKTYTSSELTVCNNTAGAGPTISCMAIAGTPTGQSEGCDLVKMKNRVNGAIANFENGNFQAGMNTLRNLQAQLARCAP